MLHQSDTALAARHRVRRNGRTNPGSGKGPTKGSGILEAAQGLVLAAVAGAIRTASTAVPCVRFWRSSFSRSSIAASAVCGRRQAKPTMFCGLRRNQWLQAAVTPIHRYTGIPQLGKYTDTPVSSLIHRNTDTPVSRGYADTPMHRLFVDTPAQ